MSKSPYVFIRRDIRFDSGDKEKQYRAAVELAKSQASAPS